MFGLCSITFGVIGSIIFAIYIKKTNRYSFITRLLTSLSLLFLILNTILFNTSPFLVGNLLLSACTGFTFTPLVPISYDLGCELAFPVG